MGGMDGSAGVFKSEAVSESSSFLAVLFRMTDCAWDARSRSPSRSRTFARVRERVTEVGIFMGKQKVLLGVGSSPSFCFTKTQQLKVIVVVVEELVVVVILETTTAAAVVVVVVVVTYSLILSVRHFFFVFLRVHFAEHVLG